MNDQTGAPPTVPRGGLIDKERGFIRRVAIVFGFAAIAYALFSLSHVLLLVFAALLFAVIIRSLVSLIERVPMIGPRIAFALGILTIFALIGGFAYLFTNTMRGQLAIVIEGLPEAIEGVGAQFGIDDPVTRLEEQVTNVQGSAVFGRAATIGATVVGALLDVLIVVMSAIYLAYDPRLYRRGFVRLFPKAHHERLEDALCTTGNALRLWFLGQLCSMVFVGVATGLAYWWLGLPAPAALGLIAGVTNFIPFVGPLIGSIPAILFAFNEGLSTVGWTVAAVLVIQQIESDVVVPLAQRRAVSLPPALALFAIIAAGLLWGFLGIFLAVPIAVALMVLVKMLWMRETLGEKTEVPGEENPPSPADGSRG